MFLLAGALCQAGPDSFREAVEADWLLQDQVRTNAKLDRRGGASQVSTTSDALGAVDGVIDGKWGFHTLQEKNPWWHVDLGKAVALDRAVLYNRCDNCGARNNRIVLSLSDDGKTWTKAYQHDGTLFQGHADKKPLAIPLGGRSARFVRLSLEGTSYFHLDEVQIYGKADPKKNIALGRPCDQSSVSQWSAAHGKPVKPTAPKSYPFALVLERGRSLAKDLLANGAPVQPLVAGFEAVAARVDALPADPAAERALYLELRWALRRLALANPLLDFESIFLTKRAPGSYSHMSDQYYGWWSRPGGGFYLLSDFRTDEPKLASITPELPTGSFLRPDLSYDGKRVLFAWCKFHPDLRGKGDKTDKESIPDDAKYHVFEMNVDGSGLRPITHGSYDDFDARYLPDGRIVFLSTRRGQAV